MAFGYQPPLSGGAVPRWQSSKAFSGEAGAADGAWATELFRFHCARVPLLSIGDQVRRCAGAASAPATRRQIRPGGGCDYSRVHPAVSEATKADGRFPIISTSFPADDFQDGRKLIKSGSITAALRNRECGCNISTSFRSTLILVGRSRCRQAQSAQCRF